MFTSSHMSADAAIGCGWHGMAYGFSFTAWFSPSRISGCQ